MEIKTRKKESLRKWWRIEGKIELLASLLVAIFGFFAWDKPLPMALIGLGIVVYPLIKMFFIKKRRALLLMGALVIGYRAFLFFLEYYYGRQF